MSWIAETDMYSNLNNNKMRAAEAVDQEGKLKNDASGGRQVSRDGAWFVLVPG